MQKQQKKIKYLINNNINFSDVLLIDQGEKFYISIEEALKKAELSNLDLVCISPNENPPVCKLLNYQKLIYYENKKKRKKENSSKEITFSFNISENDLIIKSKKIIQWLEQGAEVKIILKLINKEKTQLILAKEKCEKIIETLKNQSSAIELRDKINYEPRFLSFYVYKKRNI